MLDGLAYEQQINEVEFHGISTDMNFFKPQSKSCHVPEYIETA
jgi:hypothetical protein